LETCNENKVLVGGATGYLGKFITQELVDKGFDTKIVVRNKENVSIEAPNLEVLELQVTKPEMLRDVCNDVDTVISTIGITRQKDNVTYMDVDYQANVNLLNEARRSGVRKFIYVSVLNGDKLRHLKLGAAKERFVDYLKNSGLEYSIIRPNGFFSDMSDFLKMASGGTVFLFGDGTLKLNPIHGKDLANEIVKTIEKDETEITIGGPDLLSQNEIAELALKAYGKSIRIVHLPDVIRKLILWTLRIFTSQKTYGALEFFMTTMVMDMQAPKYGSHRLETFFNDSVRIDT